MYIAGVDELLYSFFSTVCARLENNNWGSRYPIIMKALYSGKALEGEEIKSAHQELSEIIEQFNHLPADIAVWNIDKEDTRQGEVNEGNYYAVSLDEFFVNQTGGNVLRALSSRYKKCY